MATPVASTEGTKLPSEEFSYKATKSGVVDVDSKPINFGNASKANEKISF